MGVLLGVDEPQDRTGDLVAIECDEPQRRVGARVVDPGLDVGLVGLGLVTMIAECLDSRLPDAALVRSIDRTDLEAVGHRQVRDRVERRPDHLVAARDLGPAGRGEQRRRAFVAAPGAGDQSGGFGRRIRERPGDGP